MSFLNDVVSISHTFSLPSYAVFISQYKKYLFKNKSVNSTKNSVVTIMINLGFKRRLSPSFDVIDHQYFSPYKKNS